MSTDTAVAVGVAVSGLSDRLHRFAEARTSGRLVDRCGRAIALVDDPEGMDPCPECWPHARREPADHGWALLEVWRRCADWDARYNGTIRNLDRKPLGSILK
jgi:hypothetical protein